MHVDNTSNTPTNVPIVKTKHEEKLSRKIAGQAIGYYSRTKKG